MSVNEYDTTYARELDEKDELGRFRNEFHIPQLNGQDMHYFTGNSLGLQPKKTVEFLNEELQLWQAEGVEGHFKGERPWFHYHKFTKGSSGPNCWCQAK